MTRTHTIRFRGVDAEVEWEGSKYHRATMYRSNGDPGDPEEGGFECINAVYVVLKDEKENEYRVDIYPLFTPSDEKEVIEALTKVLDKDEREYYHL